MEIVLRATVVYFFLLLLMRSLGKRELAQLSAFELILLITIGDLVQQGVTQEDMSLTGAMLAGTTLAVWALLFSLITFRWRRTRPVLEGVPVIVVRDGKILKEMLTYERITEDELREAARRNGIADLAGVQYGILEPDGKFSFIPS